MANHKSAKKRILQSEKRRVRNKGRLSQVRGAIKAFRASLVSEQFSLENSQTLFKAAQSTLQRTASKGTLHANNVSRRIKRLASALKEASTKHAA